MVMLLAVGVGVPPVAAREVAYDPGDRRDPFVPLIGPDGRLTYTFDTDDLYVEGIIIDPGRESFALINGELYREGDRVNQAHIISIMKNRVILEQEDEQKVLWIRDEIPQGESHG